MAPGIRYWPLRQLVVKRKAATGLICAPVAPTSAEVGVRQSRQSIIAAGRRGIVESGRNIQAGDTNLLIRHMEVLIPGEKEELVFYDGAARRKPCGVAVQLGQLSGLQEYSGRS